MLKLGGPSHKFSQTDESPKQKSSISKRKTIFYINLFITLVEIKHVFQLHSFCFCHNKPSVFTWQQYFVALGSNNLRRVAEVLHKLHKSLQEMHPNLMITISFSLSITLCHKKILQFCEYDCID